MRSPGFEEAQDFLLVVALAFFKEAGILNVDDPTLFVKDDENWESETAAVVQALHQGYCLFARLPRMIVHMDVLEVIVNDLADGGVIGDEVSKPQAPRAPVSSHLTDDELAFGLGLYERLVYLLQGIDILIVHLLQTVLSCHCESEQYGQQ